MSLFPAARKNAMLDALTASHLTAFDGDPTGAGAEVSPSRTAATFAAASGSARAMSTSNPEIDVPDGEQATHIAVMSASSGGVVTAYRALASAFVGPGKIRVTAWSLSLTDPA